MLAMATRPYKLSFICKDLEKPELKEYQVLYKGLDIGIICFYISDGEARIYNILISPMRQGHGRALLKQLFSHLELVALDVIPEAIIFWELMDATIFLHPNLLRRKSECYNTPSPQSTKEKK